MNIPPPPMSTPPGKESTSQSIARFFNEEIVDDSDPTLVNIVVPADPTPTHSPDIQNNSPIPSPLFPAPRLAPATRRIPAINHQSQPNNEPALSTPSQSPDRKWLFGAAFISLAILGVGLVVAALSAAVDIADRPTADPVTESPSSNILPERNSPLGVATIEGNETTSTSSTRSGQRRPAPDPAPPTTRQASTSTVAEDQAPPPSDEVADTQPASQPDDTNVDTPTEDFIPENQEQLEPETDPPALTTTEQTAG